MSVYDLLASTQVSIERLDVPFLPAARLIGPEARPERVEVWISPTGTGKTERLIPFIADARDAGERVIVVVHRTALADGSAARFGLPCYLDGSGAIKGSCVVCLDSLRRVQGPVDYLLCDEADQVATHSLGKTIRTANLIYLTHRKMSLLCRRAKKVFVQSATFQPETLEHVLTWTGRDSVRVYVNEGRPVRKRVEIYDRKLEPEAMMLQDIGVQLMNGIKVAVACTVAKDAEALGRKVADLGRKLGRDLRVKTIWCESKSEDDNAECLRDPSLFKERCDVLIYSPVMGSGVNITDKGTWSMFAFVRGFRGGPPVTEALQLIERIRYPLGNEIHCAISGSTQQDDRSEEEIYEDLRTPSKATSARFKDLGNQFHDPDDPVSLEIFRLAAKHLKMNSRLGGEWTGAFPKLLRDHDYRVEYVLPRWSEPLDLKELKQELKVEKRERILSAERITLEEAEEKERGAACTREIAAEIEAAKIRELVGTDELAPELVDFCTGGGKKQIAQMRDCVVLRRGHADRLLARDRFRHDVDKFNDCVRAETVNAALDKFGIDLEGNPDDLRPFIVAEFSEEEKVRLRQYLGMRLKDKTKSIRILRSILSYVGLALKECGWKNRKRTYKLDPEPLRKMQAWSARAIDRKINPSGTQKVDPFVETAVVERARTNFRMNRIDFTDRGPGADHTCAGLSSLNSASVTEQLGLI